MLHKSFKAQIVFFVLVSLIIFSAQQKSYGQVISTIVGSSNSGYSGNGVTVAGAKINLDGLFLSTGPNTTWTINASFFTLDDSDNIYFSDFANHCIRKINARTCIISTIAGIPGAGAYSGDGGLATNAHLWYPYDIAVNDSGDVFFCDATSNCIRKIKAATGIITTVVPGVSVPGGIVLDKVGNIYFTAVNEGYHIKKYSISTQTVSNIAGSGVWGSDGDGGPALSAKMVSPVGLALDDAQNYLYFADQAAFYVRKINLSTGIISAVAGNGVGASLIGAYTGDGGPATSASLGGPTAITLDHAGNVYIADRMNNVIRKVTASTGIITTVVGNGFGAGQGYGKGGFSGDGGAPTAAELNTPTDVALDSHGNLYILDLYNNRIRKISPEIDTNYVKSSMPAVCAGQTISFSDSSTYSLSKWQWSFPGGNPSSSTVANPVVTYDTIGTYDVILTTSNDCVTSTTHLTKYINVGTSFALTAGANPPLICAGKSTTLTVSGANTYVWSPSTGLITATGDSIMATPSTTTTYTVTGSNGGCTSTQEVVVTTSAGETAGTIMAVRDTICAGTTGSLTLTGNSSNTIQWQLSTNNNDFSNGPQDTTKYRTNPLQQTTYYRAVVGSGSCSATSQVLTLYVPPALTASFTSTQAAMNVNFSSGSSLGNITSYFWDFGDGATSTDANPVHTFNSDTIYNVCLTIYDGSNCSYTYCRNVDLKANGIATLNNDAGLIIYPDPFTDKLNISMQASGDKIKAVDMYDVLGRSVFNKIIDNDGGEILQLNVTDLPNGVYFLNVQTNKTNYLHKLIK